MRKLQKKSETFGEIVYFFKVYREKTYTDIAKEAGISVSYIKDICAGRKETVSLPIALGIMASLRIPLVDLQKLNPKLQYVVRPKELQ
jgi:transcriptional regulator with XRE-family HTH domain